VAVGPIWCVRSQRSYDPPLIWYILGYFTLRCLVLMMKMHSYMAVNGYLHGVNEEAITLERQLQEKTVEVGGWDKAVADAKVHREEFEQTDVSTPSETPALLREGPKSYFSGDGPAATALRHRLQQVAKENGSLTPHSSVRTASTVDSTVPKLIETKAKWTMPEPLPPHVLVDHPNKEVSIIAEQLSEVESELTGTYLHEVRYPANLTWWNYLDFHMLPTLVYELEYPRTDRYVRYLTNITIRIDVLCQHSPALCPRKDCGNLWYLLLVIPVHRTLHHA